MPEIILRVILPIAGVIACTAGSMLMVLPALRPARRKPDRFERVKTLGGAGIILAGFIMIALAGIR